MDCASTAGEAFTALVRTGILSRRPICALANTALTYSGVPKAGEPVRMSTLEVKPPMTHGVPGRSSWHSAMMHMASAVCCTSAPASVTGAIAPMSVNGVMTTHWPCRAMTMMLSRISSSTRRGELTLVTVISVGREARSSMLQPCSMADMAMRVLRLHAADTARRPDDIRALDVGLIGCQVAGRDRHVDRLDHDTALPVQDARAGA